MFFKFDKDGQNITKESFTLKLSAVLLYHAMSAAIQKTISDTRSVVKWLIELGMVEGIGNGRERRYMLSAKVYSITNNKAVYTRQRGWDTIQERELIS